MTVPPTGTGVGGEGEVGHNNQEGQDVLQDELQGFNGDFELNVNLQVAEMREKHRREMETALQELQRREKDRRTEEAEQDRFNRSRQLADMKNFGKHFSGKEKDRGFAVRNFLQRLDNRFEDRYVPVEHRAVLAADAMEGPAQEWWNTLVKETRTAMKADWELYKKQVTAYFTPKEYALSADTRFYKIQAASKETTEAYVARFQSVLRGMDSEPPMAIIASIFLQGMKPDWQKGVKIAAGTRDYRKMTLDHLIELLQVHAGNQVARVGDYMDVDLAQAYDTEYDDYESDPEEAQLMRIQADNYGGRRGRYRSGGRGGSRSYGRSGGSKRDNSGVQAEVSGGDEECWNCQELGHTRHRCPKPRTAAYVMHQLEYWTQQLKEEQGNLDHGGAVARYEIRNTRSVEKAVPVDSPEQESPVEMTPEEPEQETAKKRRKPTAQRIAKKRAKKRVKKAVAKATKELEWKVEPRMGDKGEDSDELAELQVLRTLRAPKVQGTVPEEAGVDLGREEDDDVEGNTEVLALSYDVNGQQLKALLDSGASACFIAAKTAARLGLETQACAPKKVVSVHGSEVCKLTARVPVKAGKWVKHVKAYVLQQMHGQEVLLGMPFFIKYHRYIEWGTREFLPPGCDPSATERGEEEFLNAYTVSLNDAKRAVARESGEMFVCFVKEQSVDATAHTDKVGRLLAAYDDIVVDELPDELPPSRGVDHEIETDDSKRAPFRRPYRMTRYEWAELDKQVKSLLARGVIRESKSPFGAPVLFIKKKTGELRMCVDYRALNDMTVKNRYPLPRIDDILDTLNGAVIFSKLDLHSGYHQVRIREEDIHKTAFTTKSGHYEYMVMPFGLCNAPSTFQKMMNDTLKPFLDKTVCVYLDDIIIFSKDVESHQKHVEEVLDRLREQKFYAKKSKCEFFKDKMEFLGHVVSAEGIEACPEKVKAVEEWPQPESGLNLMSFLGLAGYYRRFIPNYSRIASPLIELASVSTKTKRSAKPARPFLWTPECTKAFQKVKEELVSGKVMMIPTMEDPFKVSTDACDVAVGAVLQQWSVKDKAWRPVAYESAKLTAAQKNYCTREKEFYGIIHALKKWRHYLLGQPFRIETDHQSLTYFSSQTEPPSGRLSRWLDFLADYDFDIKYLPGEQNGAADALSRMTVMPVWFAESEEDEGALKVMPVWVEDEEIRELVKRGYKDDKDFGEIWDILVNDKPVPKTMVEHIRHFSIDENKLLYFETIPEGGEGKRMCIPAGLPRERMKLEAHDTPTAGHFGYYKTFDRLSRNCYWPRMIKEMREYTKSCDVCQRTKSQTTMKQGLLKQLPVPTRNWSDISMDFVSKSGLTQSRNGFDNVWVVVDRMSKQVHLIPCHIGINAEETANLYLDRIFRYHGVPKTIVSDRDVKFVSKMWRTFQHRLGTKLKFSTANHPETDGQTERVNRDVRRLLRTYVQTRPDEWDEWLPVMEFAINSAVHSTTGYSPFEVNYGFVPDGPAYESTFMMDRPHHQMDEWLEKMKTVQGEVRDRIVEMQGAQEARVNQHRRDVSVKVGDMVLVHRKAYYNKGEDSKMHDVFFGPYRALKQVYDNAFEVALPPESKRHRNINVQFLKKYEERDEYLSQPPVHEEQQRANIHTIVRFAGMDQENEEVLCTWEGCDPLIATPVPRALLEECMDPARLEQLTEDWLRWEKFHEEVEREEQAELQEVMVEHPGSVEEEDDEDHEDHVTES
ncbi:Retrovirus-related Pol polyprotein from transposon 17.6 [Yarrowia lipolytica]|nr:Retrovirus-related Pol polyprotein from transposon 17.6 [Yarrowia lipolytica]